MRVWLQWCGRKLSALSPRQILLIGFGVFLLYSFPGYMSTDSAQQLAEARSGHFSDAHPPLMAQEWRWLDWIVSGPLLMLLLQGTLFLGGLYVLFKKLLSPRAAAWTAIGILLFPPVLTPMGVIWKDSQMAAYLIAGTAALVQPRLRVRLVGLGLLTAACALRHNALAAAIPLVFFLFEWKPGLRWWKRIAILAGAAVLTVGLTCGVTRVLAADHVRLTPAFSDIVGVIALSEDRTDEDLRNVLRGTNLVVTTNIQARARLLYELHGTWRIAGGEYRLFNYPETPEHWAALNRAWKELVLENPGVYLRQNWGRFASVIGWSDDPPRAAVWGAFLELPEHMLPIDHNASGSWAQACIVSAFVWLVENTPLFRPYIYALIALILLVLCCRDRLTAGLFTSGLLYELSFFPTGVDPDYRYSHWLITSVCVATVILFVQRRRRAPSSTG